MLRASISSLRTVMLFAALLAMLALLLLAPAAQPAQASHGGTLPITGELSNGGTFSGTVTDLHAGVNRAGKLVISGVLNGKATMPDGTVTRVTDEAFRTTATIERSTCRILDLELGPLDLDLLGLQVHLNQVVLHITAEQGPGNLLGNLLCAVAGLLDGGLNLGSIGDALASLLNSIFGLIE